MNKKISHHRSIRIMQSIIISFTGLFLLTGCSVVSDILKGPPPPQPPPPATWSSSPDFSPASISKIAILVEDGSQTGWRRLTTQYPSSTVVEDAFIKAAFQKGYAVSDRSDVQQVLQEIRFQQSGLTESDAARLGRMLNVPAVLIVKITGSGVDTQQASYTVNGMPQYWFSAWCNMSARLISVEKAEVLGLSSYSMRIGTANQNDPTPAISFVAEKLAEALPARNSP